MRRHFSSNLIAGMVLFIVLTSIFETGAFLINARQPGERFFQLYLFGADNLVEDYYPNNSPNLQPLSVVSWYVGVANNMGNVQLVEIRVKLANATVNAPNDTNFTPSPASAILSFDRVLLNNETMEFPFVWSVSNTSSSGESVHILGIRVNNQTYPISDCSAVDGYGFRIIFELWVYQDATNSFAFDWGTNGEHKTTWLQIWFNMTA